MTNNIKDAIPFLNERSYVAANKLVGDIVGHNKDLIDTERLETEGTKIMQNTFGIMSGPSLN